MDADEALCVLIEMFADVEVAELQGCLREAGGDVGTAVELQLRKGPSESGPSLRLSLDACYSGEPPAEPPTPPSQDTGCAREPKADDDLHNNNGRRCARRGRSQRKGSGWHSLGGSELAPRDERNNAAAAASPRFVPSLPLRGAAAVNANAAQNVTSGRPPGVPSRRKDSPQSARKDRRAASSEILGASHPWAERDLVEAVLAAVAGDADSAGSILSEMAADDCGDEAEAAGSNNGAAAGDDSPAGEDDLYWRFRREAVREGRTLRKLQKQAAAATAVGDYSLARQCTEQAQQLGRRVASMHHEAALQIEAELNGSLNWEDPEAVASLRRLDLHGLHVEEALEALERRLRIAEGLLHSCKRAPRRLDVIVGRGRHSSNGEASIPRAVESYLLRRGNNFKPGRVGCLDVSVRRRANQGE